ncbi:hypothetical protein [Pseudonocardia xishanensis]|uniref:Uncharacterized protein n=1 Tax=Pseudonocardia xishanensis TaxID=630995 RepID=A0ABP8RUX3_9PSEU
MSRGRDNNTAHIATETAVEDPADGRADQTVRRDPVAALAAVLDPDGRTEQLSALATATRSTDETESVRTPAELLADAAQLAATHRTATWLDDLAADGTLSIRDRARIAAEDGAASLTRVLRSAELAGYDPRQVLADAIADRSLEGVRNATNVIYSRITDRYRFDPITGSWAERTPRVGDPEWQAYLDRLAEAADDRTARLADAAVADPPGWAVREFGGPPADPVDLRRWRSDVGRVEAYRELRGHTGDTDALGPAPAPGQVEAFAAYRDAWRALGRPEIDRDEVEMSDGQLRMRIRAAEREAAWGPRYVANELAGTHQAAQTQRHRAAMLAAEADLDGADREQLTGQSRDATALAETLDKRAAELQQLDDARARWLAHTAGTRAAGERAQVELAQRHADDTDQDPQVTAEEWLAAHREAQIEDERHRDIVADYELDDHRDAPDLERVDLVVDIRETAAGEGRLRHEDAVRVPTADETSAAIDRAHRALAEIHARDIYDDSREAEELAAEAWRSPSRDAAEEHEAIDDSARKWT